MPAQDPDDQYLRVAMMVMLSLALLAGVCATAIHWLGPVHRPMDRVLPPVASALLAGLLCALWLRPAWVGVITRIALCLSALALMAPAWLYTVQASLSPELRLIDTLPPISSLFAVFMAMLMIFVPGRRAFVAAAVGWLLVASPVLVYLLTHPGELGTPRGVDLAMAFGPASLMLVVLLPVQRGLTGKIRRLASERDGIEVQLHRDPLTGVHSRLFGERVLRDLVARGGTAGLVMLDLDRFKAINDTYGHPAGDGVLRAVAASCERLLRPSERIARWGGEEFLVILPDVNAAVLHGIADRLRVAIAAVPVAPVAQVTASLGTAVLHPADTLETALQRVDRALYRAKQLGGNCIGAAETGADAAVPVGAADVVAAEPAAASVALPVWFPDDVYLPADHVVAEVNESSGAHAVELRTRGEVLDIAEQARAAMLAAGWTEKHYSPVDTRGGASMYYRKGDRSATLAMAWGNTGQVRVMYNFATVE